MSNNQTDKKLPHQEFYNSSSEETDCASDKKSMFSVNINPCDIDRVVDLEVQRIRQNFVRGEQQYVEKMLVDNPIPIAERPGANQRQPQNEEGQQRRANAYRRSRFNNRVKKAKLTYRHQYISKKLAQTSEMLKSVLDFVTEAEQKVLRQGLPHNQLKEIRESCRVDSTLNELVQFYATMPVEY